MEPHKSKGFWFLILGPSQAHFFNSSFEASTNALLLWACLASNFFLKKINIVLGSVDYCYFNKNTLKRIF